VNTGEYSAAARQPDSDAFLIQQVREGLPGGFDVLYSRHFTAASRTARLQADNPSDIEDIVAEAFTSIYQKLAAGKGPDMLFRPYLLAVIRRIAHHHNRRSSALYLTDDNFLLDTPYTDDDMVLQTFESSTIARAFSSLPQRWQSVLRFVDIEGFRPAAAAPYFGLSANAVSALLLRARKGLRRAYLIRGGDAPRRISGAAH
jgi:RNA polymerase sigma factor (sigma-70 family)